MADSITNQVYLLKQCDRCSFLATGRERNVWLRMKAADRWQRTPSYELYAKSGSTYVGRHMIHPLESSIKNKWVRMTSSFSSAESKSFTQVFVRIAHSHFVLFVYKMWYVLVDNEIILCRLSASLSYAPTVSTLTASGTFQFLFIWGTNQTDLSRFNISN